MSQKTAVSVIDVIKWLIDKSEQNHQILTACQLQNILFLSQMHHLGKLGQVLIPTMFVCRNQGFYDPATDVIINNKLYISASPDFTKETNVILESVWQKYSRFSEQELIEFITSLPYWQHFHNNEKEIIINPLSSLSLFTSSIAKHKPSPGHKLKIRFSQNGPVKVSPWHPRKVNITTSNKKGN